MKSKTVLLLGLLFWLPSFLHAQFHVDTLAQAPAIDFPVAIAFPPDGSHRLFFTEKNLGIVRVIRNDTLLTAPFLTVPVKSYGEQGMLGITFHPQYPDSPYVYVYYTRTGDSANVVARYTDSAGTGVNPRQVFIAPRTTTTSSHNGGNIHFGPDGKLYITVGDYYDANNSQDTSNTNKRGKIHRINQDGSIPADNPFPGNSLYIYGVRNSFDFTWDKLNGQMYASENGPDCNDEINNIHAGGNYGWPIDGNCTYLSDPTYVKPMYHWTPTIAPTGITVYRDTIFPSLYGKLLLTSYNYNKIIEIGLNSAGDSVNTPPQDRMFIGSSLIDLQTGPDGYLYLANSTFNGTSRILRLRPAIAIPAPPVLHYPAGNATNQPIPFTCIWSQTAESETYDVQLATDQNFNNVVVDTLVEVDTLGVINTLSYSTKYYWHVKAKNSLGASTFSTTRSFTTVVAPPLPPILASPDSNALNQPTSFILRWHPSARAASYTLELAIDSNFTLVQNTYAGLTDTARGLGSLDSGVTFYWRVNASNLGGASDFSIPWRFTTIAPLPGAPALSVPPNHSTGQPFTVALQWSPVNAAESYHLQIGKDSAFLRLVFDDSSLTTISDTLYNLVYSTTYYWRVAAINLTGTGAWSPVWNFTTVLKSYNVNQNWNIVSLPLNITGETRTEIFPTATSYSFEYKSGTGYKTVDTLEHGKGYWLKFGSADSVPLPGTIVHVDSVEVFAGWNLIGSISDTVATSSIQSIPPGIIEPHFFGFNSGYAEVTTILPGVGYWVKADSDGILILTNSSVSGIPNHTKKQK